MPRSVRGTFVAGIILAIALIISVIGSIITYSELSASFDRHVAVDRARDDYALLYRLQLDEESGLRGYLAAGQKSFLQPYYDARPRYEPTWSALQRFVGETNLPKAAAVLGDLHSTHDRWRRVADALIAAPTAPSSLARQKQGKYLVDRMRGDFGRLDAMLESQIDSAVNTARALLIRASTSTAALILLFGLAALIADIVRSRTQVALERERMVADTLQRAFLSGWDVLPYLRVGTAYVSATGETAVGGDLFDVHRLDEHRSIVLVADVSGKGINAAVETAFVKYSVRALAEDYSDPAKILEKFNRSFLRSATDLGAFVVVFVAFLDDRDLSMRYASAGHAPAYLRRGADIQQLAVTGPVVGLTPDTTFGSTKVALKAGDTLIVATDGLTEARDSSGTMLQDEGAIRWIRSSSLEPQALADDLVQRVSVYSGGRIADDLALLVIQITPVAADEGLPRIA